MNDINKKILIVEDDEDFLSILKIKFSAEGFNVVTAENGEEGVSVAEQEKPDLILADVLMPKMDGVAMAKKIKEANSSALIMLLTNLKDIDGKKPDGFDYIIKSELKISDIVDKVKNKLGLPIAQTPDPVPPAAPVPPTPKK